MSGLTEMARFDVSGLDELLADMKRQGELAGQVADKMLMAAAEEVKEAWRDEAKRRDFHDVGDMIESIGFAGKPKTAKDIRIIEIYPQGKDKKGVRNAEKAFVLHYGRKGSGKKRRKGKKFSGPGIPVTHWVDSAEEKAGPRTLAVMERIWDEHLKG